MVLKTKHHYSSETIRQTDIFIRRWAGKRVLMVRQEALADLVPDEHRFLARSDVRARLIRDGGHLTNNRRLEPGMTQERLYCFVMPPTAKGE